MGEIQGRGLSGDKKARGEEGEFVHICRFHQAVFKKSQVPSFVEFRI